MKTKDNYYINPHIFFLFSHGSLCLWNYKAHEQFEISSELVKALEDISNGTDIGDHPLLNDLIHNDIVRKEPYENSTWGWDRLSEIFHIGTQNVPELQESRTKAEMIQDFLGFSEDFDERKQSQNISQSDSNDTDLGIELPSPQIKPDFLPFKDTLLRRMTSRQFSAETISANDLSSILHYTFGDQSQNWANQDDQIQLLGSHKTSPGAGGLHSVKAYVTIFSVENFSPGLYNYDAINHTLVPIHNDVSWDKLIHIMADQFYMHGLSFGVFFVSDLDVVWTKYLHSRAYREIFLDTGHLSQTMQLLATSLSLNTWISGYFRDESLIDYLQLAPHQAPVLYVGVGKGERTPIHPDMREALKKT